MIRLVSILALTVTLAAQSPKNVILLVGDGMGPAHFTFVHLKRDADSQIGRMPVVGLVMTRSADHAVTDSAAAASAYATGVKVNNRVVSIDPSGARPQTVLEAAEAAGKATGLVTTSYFYDATPAAFAAHMDSRYKSAEIADQMLRSGVELIAGGQPSSFGKAGDPSIRELASRAGFTVVTSREALDRSAAAHVLALFDEQPHDVDFPDAPLADLARSAIARLSQHPKGFFLVIEHEGTDSGSHENNAASVTRSMISFDQAVGVALDFAAQSGDTLVVVTGDHETGGMRISESSAKPRIEWSTSEHTATAIPIFAYGPGAAAFGHLLDNTDVGKHLLAAMK